MRKQKGAALIVVLSLLSMSLMVGLSSMNSSITDERLAGNYRSSTEAQMNAEIAASAGWGENEKLDFKTTSSETYETIEEIPMMGWEDFMDDGNFDNQPPSDDFCDKKTSSECRFRPITMQDKEGENGNYIISMGVVAEAESHPIIIKIKLPDGNMALHAGGSINVNGASTIDGRAHANSDNGINADFEQINEDLGKREDDGLTSGYNISLPVINFSSYTDRIELPREEGKGKNKGEYVCDFSFSGDLDGAVYYCDGNIEIDSSFENATLLSSGDVSNNGAIVLGDYYEKVKTEIIAMGDISFSGSSVVYGGGFLAGGDVNQNGSSSFYGSIAAYGDINRNGSAEFVYKENEDPSGKPEIEYWR